MDALEQAIAASQASLLGLVRALLKENDDLRRGKGLASREEAYEEAVSRMGAPRPAARSGTGAEGGEGRGSEVADLEKEVEREQRARRKAEKRLARLQEEFDALAEDHDALAAEHDASIEAKDEVGGGGADVHRGETV